MAEYGHDELIAMFRERGGMQSLGTLKGAAVIGQLAIPQASDPIATAPAHPSSWLSLGLK